MGSPLYIAPEVYEGHTDLKSDVWSLGISLIEVATGQNPFEKLNKSELLKAVMVNESPSLSTLEGWSSSFVHFVDRCLKKKVEERASVDELLNAVLLGCCDS